MPDEFPVVVVVDPEEGGGVTSRFFMAEGGGDDAGRHIRFKPLIVIFETASCSHDQPLATSRTDWRVFYVVAIGVVVFTAGAFMGDVRSAHLLNCLCQASCMGEDEIGHTVSGVGCLDRNQMPRSELILFNGFCQYKNTPVSGVFLVAGERLELSTSGL